MLSGYYVICLVVVLLVIKGREDILSDGLSCISIEFLVSAVG